VNLPLPASPSYEALCSLAVRFEPFSGGRDLFAALTVCAAAGLDGDELTRAVNDRLTQDEQEQGVPLDRLRGDWLALWEEALSTYRELWPVVQPELERTASGLRGRLEPVWLSLVREMTWLARSRSGIVPSRIMVAVVERGLGMHRASDGVAVLEAVAPDQLWPYGLTHELVHAITPRHRPESAVHQLAGEMLTDLSAAHLGAGLADNGSDPMLTKDLDKRWEGWKLAYGVKNSVSAPDAHARALTVWHELLEGRGFFEDAVDRLAQALDA
jgi:hypothetical protein